MNTADGRSSELLLARILRDQITDGATERQAAPDKNLSKAPAAAAPHSYRQLDPTEAEIVEAAMAGDSEALARAVERNRARLESSRHGLHLFPTGSDPASIVIAGPRQSGKTVSAAEWVKAGRTYATNKRGFRNDRILVVRNDSMARNAVSAHDLLPDEVATLRRVRESMRSVNGSAVAVDDAQEIIADALNLLGVPALISVNTPT